MAVKVRKLYTNKAGDPVYGLKIDTKGNRSQISVGSKSAANRLKKDVELEIARGTFGLIDTPAPTFEKVAREYLSLKKITKAPRTHGRYKVIIDKHLRSAFLKKQIDTITRGDIRNELTNYYSSGASKSSVEMMHTVISGVFGHAVDDETLKHSPAAGVLKRLEIPGGPTKINPFSAQDFEHFLSKVKQDYRDVYRTLYYTGMRVGELLALEWADVDLVNRTISISKTAKDQQVRKCTKNYLIREIEMADSLHTLLAKLKEQDAGERTSKGKEQRTVFHNSGRLLSQQTLWRNISNTCKQHGLGRRTIHDIRHTTASLLLARGVPVTYVSKLLGHSSVRITLERYLHFIPSENAGAINVLDGVKNSGYKDARN